ncbi:Proline-serine-threonine phosphatase-interacting protein 2, partial [Ophiophagus hannah]
TTDLISTAGYDNIVQHLNDGRKNCKEFEDFLRERASVEERYGKELINLSRKKPCGQTELNGLGEPSEEAPSEGHWKFSSNIELIMDAIHKNRNLQYKKTLEAKRLYEQRCRDKDEAEQAVHRSSNLVTPKQQEKLFVKLAQAKSALEDSECERINYFRNAMWLHVNQLSEGCVKNDDNYEEIRKALEQCSIGNDIECFVHIRKTGNLPPVPIVYENYYNTQKNTVPRRSQVPVPGTRPQMPIPSSEPGDANYASVDGYSLIHPH